VSCLLGIKYETWRKTMADEMMALRATDEPRLMSPKMTTTTATNMTDHCGTRRRGCTAPR
jgi:hypothetical protein